MNIILYEKAVCGYDEKLSCLDTVSRVLNYARVARFRGLIGVGDELENEENPVLRKGLELVVEAYDPELVERIICNYIIFSGYTGAELLEALIALEGLLHIQMGRNPTVIKTALFAYFGTDCDSLLAEYGKRNNDEYREPLYEYYEYLRTNKIMPPESTDEKLVVMLTTPPNCFQLLVQLNPVELAYGICCLKGQTQRQILACLPYARARRVVNEINAVLPENRGGYFKYGQDILNQRIKELIESGVWSEGYVKSMPTHIVAVGGVVENGQGEILIVKHNNGEWGCPGGQVENGENLIDALIREILEESGINVKVEKLFWVGSNTSAHEGHSGVRVVPTKVIFNFICSFVSGEPRGSDETTEACWIKKEKALDMLPIMMRDRFNAYLDFDGTVRYMEYSSRPYELKLIRNI